MADAHDATVQRQALDAAEDCLRRAARHYGRRFRVDAFRFTVRGQAAGWARQDRAGRIVVNFNPRLLRENLKDFLATTIPHEVAHAIQYQLYPGSRPHGPEWRSIMAVLGAPARRTHAYRTAPTGQTYAYRCRCRDHTLSAIRHRRAQTGTRYHCTACKSILRLQDRPSHLFSSG